MTLKELMGDKINGDGRRFTIEYLPWWFEPIFLAQGIWHGRYQDGRAGDYLEISTRWKEYVEPKKKKVEMWKWAYKGISDKWVETNDYHAKQPVGVIGWVRVENSRLEVEE